MAIDKIVSKVTSFLEKARTPVIPIPAVILDKISKMFSLETGSTLAVGSSNTKILGDETNARAISKR